MEIAPGTGNRLLFVTAPLVVAAGACSSVVSIQSQNAQGGEPVPAPSLTTIRLSAYPAAGFRFYSDASCATEVSTTTLAAGTTNASFYFKATKAGNATVTVTAVGYTGSSQAETVNPGPPAAIALSGPGEVPAGSCSDLVTVELRDSQGNPTAATADTVINFAASGIPLTFFPRGECTSSATSMTIPRGSSSAVFSFRGVQAGNSTLSGASTGLATGTLAVTIASSPASVLTVTTGSQTLPAGNCSAPVNVQVGPAGSPMPVAAALAVNLSAPPAANVTFYSSSSCSSAVSQISIPAGQSSASFYFRSTKVGTATLTAAATGLTSASQPETITVAAPTRLLFSTPPQTSMAGACSPLVTVQSVDPYGNVSPVTATNERVSFSPSFRSTFDGEFRFYSDPSCTTSVTSVTFRSGESSVGVYYRGVKAQVVNVQLFGTALTGSNQDHTVIPANARTLSFSPSTPPQTLLAGTCALRTVQGRDAYDNPSANALTVTLSAEQPAEFFLDAACTMPATQVAIGTGSSSADFYFKGLTGGLNDVAPLTLRADSPGLVGATQTETVIPTVRTGSCSFSGTSTRCTVTPPLEDPAKAFLVFQATTTGTSNAETHVRCYLSGSSEITCDRADVGSTINVRWSVAEFPSGVAVQHQSVSCSSFVSLFPSVLPDRSFLLLSGKRSGTAQDFTALRYAELTSPSDVRIGRNGSCSSSSDASHLQVVEYAGASVQRGLYGWFGGGNLQQVDLPTAVAPDRSILLYSYISSSSSFCGRMLRGELTSNGATISFSRGLDSGTCASATIDPISWEVVQFPPGTVVQQVSQQLAGPSATVTLPNPVDLSRTIVIAGGQWASGQAQGEGLSSTSIGEMRAQAQLTDSSTLQITREKFSNAAAFTVFVVQLKP